MSRVQQIYKKIKKLNKELMEIQDECSHPKHALKIKKCGDSGNYDPSDDRYWIEYHCTLCDKRWDEDQ